MRFAILTILLFWLAPLAHAERALVYAASSVSIASGGKYYFGFDKEAGHDYEICVETSSGNANLYGHYTGYPSTSSYQYRSTNTGTADDCIEFTATSSGGYYLMIYGSSSSKFTYYIVEDP